MSAKDKVSLSMGGTFRFVQQRPPRPGAQFEDEWDRLPDGTVVPKDHRRVVQDALANNKYTKRGLSFFLYALQAGHGLGSALIDPSLTGDVTSNPFETLFLMADVPSPPRPTPYVGDARVEWAESDTAYDGKIPPAPTPGDGTSHFIHEGRRCCKYHGTGPDTAAPGLKFISDSWIGAPPYGEVELLFYAQSQLDSTVLATGFVDMTGVAGWVDGTDTFTLDDGLNLPVIFEFDTDGVITEGVPGTNLRQRIYVGDAPALTVVAQRIRDAINAIGDKLYISAEVDDVITTRVNLTHYAGGSIGNVAITETVADANFTKLGMTGGTDAGVTGSTMTDTQIDNFPIKSVGMAKNRACGDGETDSKIGLRAVLGLPPTIQGICDRRWLHEKFDYSTGGATDLHMYTGGETIAAVRGALGTADGYVVSGEAADDVVATFDAGVAFVAGTKQFTLDSAAWSIPDTVGFDETHMRWVLRVSSSATGGNDRDYHIRKIVSPHVVQTFEAPAADDDDTTTPALQVQLVRTYVGENVFDGHVENEGLTEAPTLHSDPRATVIPGEKWVSVNSAGPHLIGRVFDTPLSPGGVPHTINKFRLMAPPGLTREYLPDEFTVQILDGGASPPVTVPDLLEPANNLHWSTVETFSGGEGANIYTAGLYGKEYTITSPIAGYGIRLSAIRSESDTQHVELAQFMISEDAGVPEGFPVTLSSARLKTSVDGGLIDRYLDIPDVAAAAEVQEVANALNQVLLGREMEAVRTEFGYLLVRGTVQGDNSILRVYDYGASGTLGLTSGGDEDRTGLTQIVRKLVMNSLTILYRFSVFGNTTNRLKST